MNQKTLITLSAIAVLTLAFFATFGANFSMGNKHENSNFHCPLSSSTNSLCNTDLLVHLENWEQAFLSVFKKNLSLILSALILLIVIGKIFSSENFNPFLNKLRPKPDREPAKKELTGSEIFSALRRGIIHPKVYVF